MAGPRVGLAIPRQRREGAQGAYQFLQGQRVRHRPQLLARVVVVQSRLGLGKTIPLQIPNPQGAIGYDQHFIGWRQTVALGFGKQLFLSPFYHRLPQITPSNVDRRPFRNFR